MCGVAELATVPLYVVKAKNSTLPCRTCDLGYGWTDLDHWVCEKCEAGFFANGTFLLISRKLFENTHTHT
jgi:hypothetical protein